MTINVEVTQRDIDTGVKGNCCFCPVSLAIKRIVPRYVEVGVYCNKIFFMQKFTRVTIDTPISVFHFVRDFDNGKLVKPFTFVLEKVLEGVFDYAM